MKLAIIVALFAATSVVCAKDWWQNGNFYQIYPRSFRDSNGDGIGDLNGITEKLQYIKDVGFTAAWLSPIFKSPMADFGYDISDFYQIHPEYGTMEDFENLIKKAKEVGLKIILDFVPNHTSDENEWFKKSVDSDPKYKDFYIWHDGKYNQVSGKREPPSNWLSAFRYSAWKWNDVRQQYYLHQFAEKQPDLNYRNQAVVEEMKNVMRFWLAKGISGFRIDACPFLFEVELDANNNYADEPVIKNISACPDKDDYCHLQHIYTNDLPETMDMIYQWRELTDQFKKDHGGYTRILLTEAYTKFENMIKYYGDGKRNGSHVPFNFDFMSNINKDSKAEDVVWNVRKWLSAMPKDVYANWVLGNHDNKRLASRFGVERADLLNILLQTLPGNAVTYNGEELAMTDVYISWSETVDPQACNANPDNFNKYSRDPARSPFQWDASPYAVRNVLRSEGFNGRVPRKKPLISKTNQKKLLEYTKTHFNKPQNLWDSVIFSDESKFNIFASDGRAYVWRKPNEELKSRNLIKTDNDPKHTARRVKEWLIYNIAKQLHTPSQTRDLNPIEHLWDEIGRRLKKYDINNKNALKEAILSDWNSIEPDVTKKYEKSFN